MYTEKQLAEAGLDKFINFVTELWLHLDLKDTKGNPSPPTVMQTDIADYLQYGPRRCVIEAFRGVGKSWITAAFVIWCLLKNPQAKILVVSANQERSDAFSTFVKQLLDDVEWLTFLSPGPGQRSSNLKFDVRPATPDQSPSVKSAGITGQITGSRADFIVADDIEIPKNSYTHLLRERLADLVKEFDAILKPNGRIIYLGTPQVEQSLYNRLPARGYEIRIWPSEIPGSTTKYGGRLAPIIQKMVESGIPKGTPTDPRRFDRDDLDERRISYGHSGYALQFMLDTNPSDIDRHPLKLHDLLIDTLDSKQTFISTVWSNDKQHILNDLEAIGFDGDYYYAPAFREQQVAPYSQVVMAIDPSGGGKDETGYAIVKLLYSQLYLVDSGGFVDGFSERTLHALASKCSIHGVTDVIVEKNYGGGMFSSLFRPILALVSTAGLNPDDEVFSTGQKEVRILDVMEPLMNSHRLTIDRRVIEKDILQYQDEPKYSLIQQMTRLTRDKDCLPHEDRLESLSEACKFFIAKLDRDAARQVRRHKSNLIDKELKRFVKHAVSPLNTMLTPRKNSNRNRHIRGGRR